MKQYKLNTTPVADPKAAPHTSKEYTPESGMSVRRFDIETDRDEHGNVFLIMAQDGKCVELYADGEGNVLEQATFLLSNLGEANPFSYAKFTAASYAAKFGRDKR